MREQEAEAFVRERFVVDSADIRAARSWLLQQPGMEVEVDASGRQWAEAATGTAIPRPINLVEGDPASALLAVARYYGRFFAFCRAATELISEGIALPCGSVDLLTVKWDTRHHGNFGGLDIQELRIFYPPRVVRPHWMRNLPGDPARNDLYLHQLATVPLHAGIADALRTALQCFRQDLFLPALAMLDSASEGAWIECGGALANVHHTSTSATRLRRVLDSPYGSIMERIKHVQDAYASPAYASVQTSARVKPKRLEDIAQWSGVVRESRNVLHWSASLASPNTYTKTAALMLSALDYFEDLHAITETAKQQTP